MSRYDRLLSFPVCLIACVILYLYDAAKGGVLNRSAAERRKLLVIEEEKEYVNRLCKPVVCKKSLFNFHWAHINFG